MNWDYKQPVQIIFGNGRLSELPVYVGEAKRPLVISTPFFVRSGLAQKVAAAVGGGIFSAFSENPDVEEVNTCSEQVRREGTDCIIAIGGGSAMDLAKAVSAAVEDIREYHGTGKPLAGAHIPLIAIPTTAGTGSEVSAVSVLTDRKTGRKAPIASDDFYPRTAIVDPELTVSAPPKVTASAGIDVLCHAIEGYWSKGHQPICDALAIAAAKTVFRYLPLAYREPEHLKARERMAEASLLAGLAFVHPKTTSSHACSYPLTAIYNIPHGEACGLTLDYFARVNAADPRTETLARELGFDSVESMADAILTLKKEVGLRCDLRDLRLSGEALETLVAESHHPNLLNNPVRITDDILRDLYEQLSK